MAANRYIVFGALPEGATEADFNEWYDAHLPEILSIPGFVAVQRYEIEPSVADEQITESYRYIALFEIEGDTERAMEEMAKRNLSTTDSYVVLKEDDDDTGPALPSWWANARFASWTAVPVGPRAVAKD
jgi:hypothetical protein